MVKKLAPDLNKTPKNKNETYFDSSSINLKNTATTHGQRSLARILSRISYHEATLLFSTATLRLELFAASLLVLR